jgi:hypothetical protein
MATKRKPLAERVAHDPALLRKALANPGLRSKLPDKYLSAITLDQYGHRLPCAEDEAADLLDAYLVRPIGSDPDLSAEAAELEGSE